MIKKIAYLGVIGLLFLSIISCEKDFTNIGTDIVKNTKFNTKSLTFYVNTTASNINPVRTDNIELGNNKEIDYLLGIYENDDYRKLEASLVSQLSLGSFKKLGKDSSRVIDKAFLTIPFPATKSKKKGNKGKPIFTVDNVIGDKPENVTIRVYRNGTFLNRLDPKDPTKKNRYFSSKKYKKLEELTKNSGHKLSVNPNDTLFVFKRFKTKSKTENYTFKLNNKSVSPFLTIPLDKNKIKKLLLDKATSTELSSPDNFANYFRGLIIEATGNDGALIPFSFSGISPSLHIYYTDFLQKKGKVVGKVKHKSTVFPLSGITNSMYKSSLNSKNSIPNNSITLQGAVGLEAEIKLLTKQQIEELRSKNLLINDASLTFYINGTLDTANVPKKILLYKEYTVNDKKVYGHVKDAYTETLTFGGNLKLSNKKPNRYTLKITDYISSLLDPKSNETLPTLKLKVFNTFTDKAVKGKVLDTIVKSYSWNPATVTIFNGSNSVAKEKRAQLKISYSEKK